MVNVAREHLDEIEEKAFFLANVKGVSSIVINPFSLRFLFPGCDLEGYP